MMAVLSPSWSGRPAASVVTKPRHAKMNVATSTNSALRRVVGLIWKNLLLVTSRLPTRKSELGAHPWEELTRQTLLAHQSFQKFLNQVQAIACHFVEALDQFCRGEPD